MNRPLFPTTLSIPSYDIEKQVGLRTYQQPLAMVAFCEDGNELCSFRVRGRFGWLKY